MLISQETIQQVIIPVIATISSSAGLLFFHPWPSHLALQTHKHNGRHWCFSICDCVIPGLIPIVIRYI